MLLRYTDYERNWDEIAGRFARETVLKGAFDKFAESAEGKRGTAAVDAAFLGEIEAWRDALARNIALRNPALGQRGLNDAVQRTIDRLIFLRLCEDRGIEHYGRLRDLAARKNVYDELKVLFQQADDRYNSGLFHFHAEKGRTEYDGVTLDLAIDDKVLKPILGRLYYPDSPYEFSVLPADILGQVYEQFLGKVIRLTPAHQAKVEEKPEVRKAGGVYYTPTYIVDYIVQNTVGKLLEGKKPADIDGSKPGTAPLRVLDPACGSGSFLIVAYQFLLDWHLKACLADGPEKHCTGKNPRLRHCPINGHALTVSERKRILLNHIYGVDIDAQSVEVTKLSLLLKVLEGESAETLGVTRALFQERALPDLDNNIKCGNSLIGPDFYKGQQADAFDAEEMYRVNAFDWKHEFPFIVKDGGFDVVVGNPPYDVLEKERGGSSWPHYLLGQYARTASVYMPALGGKLNLFRFFIIKSIELTAPLGRFGMIMPLSLLADISCAATRKYLLTVTEDILAACFPQKDNANRRVFKAAKLSTAIITAKRTNSQTVNQRKLGIRVYPWNSFDDPPRECELSLSDLEIVDPLNIPVPLVSRVQWDLCKKLYSGTMTTRLGNVKDYVVTRGEINQTIYRKYIVESPSSRTKRLVKGVELARYMVRDRLSQGVREWFDEGAFLLENSPRSQAGKERISMQRITGVDERLRIVATIIPPPAYYADSTNSVMLSDDANHSLHYLLTLLNSRLFQWRFKLTSTNNNVGTNELLSLPFRAIIFTDKDEKMVHDLLVSRAKAMISLHDQLPAATTEHERKLLQRQITATDHEIDQLVYALYGLTAEEIAIVEGAG